MTKLDVDDRLSHAHGDDSKPLSAGLGAHDQLKERLKDNETQRKRADD